MFILFRSTEEDEESEKARKQEEEPARTQIPKMQAPEGMQIRLYALLLRVIVNKYGGAVVST